jgi:hypothetical protein
VKLLASLKRLTDKPHRKEDEKERRGGKGDKTF